MLAAVLADAGDFAGSDQLYVHLLAATPDDPELLVAHGQNLVHRGELTRPTQPSTKPRKSTRPTSTRWSGLAFTASRTAPPRRHSARAHHALPLRCLKTPRPSSFGRLPTIPCTRKQQAAAYYHRFLDAAAGKLPDQEWQARQRLQAPRKIAAVPPRTQCPSRVSGDSFVVILVTAGSKYRILVLAVRCENVTTIITILGQHRIRGGSPMRNVVPIAALLALSMTAVPVRASSSDSRPARPAADRRA